MHRALQIVGAVTAALRANASLAAEVYSHRVRSLDELEQELPAVIVRMGADTPNTDSGQSSLSFIDSMQEILVEGLTRGDSEQEIAETLLELRTQIHIALQADVTLGLSFVTDTRYAGADAPEISDAADRYSGRLVTRWSVLYRTAFTNPS